MRESVVVALCLLVLAAEGASTPAGPTRRNIGLAAEGSVQRIRGSSFSLRRAQAARDGRQWRGEEPSAPAFLELPGEGANTAAEAATDANNTSVPVGSGEEAAGGGGWDAGGGQPEAAEVKQLKEELAKVEDEKSREDMDIDQLRHQLDAEKRKEEAESSATERWKTIARQATKRAHDAAVRLADEQQRVAQQELQDQEKFQEELDTKERAWHKKLEEDAAAQVSRAQARTQEAERRLHEVQVQLKAAERAQGQWKEEAERRQREAATRDEEEQGKIRDATAKALEEEREVARWRGVADRVVATVTNDTRMGQLGVGADELTRELSRITSGSQNDTAQPVGGDARFAEVQDGGGNGSDQRTPEGVLDTVSGAYSRLRQAREAAKRAREEADRARREADEEAARRRSDPLAAMEHEMSGLGASLAPNAAVLSQVGAGSAGGALEPGAGAAPAPRRRQGSGAQTREEEEAAFFRSLERMRQEQQMKDEMRAQGLAFRRGVPGVQ